MTTTIWDSLNKQGGTYNVGMYVVQLDDNFYLGEYMDGKFSPIANNYFQTKPTMLDRGNWYFMNQEGIIKPMEGKNTKERQAYEAIFFKVMQPFAPFLPQDADFQYGNSNHWGAAMNRLVKIQKQVLQKSKQQTKNPKSSALANVQDFLSQIDPYLAQTINRQDFHQLTKNDLNLYNQASKIALAMKKHGWSAEQQDIVDKLDSFLNTRAEAQIISTLDVKPEERIEYLKNYFRQLPDLKKGTIPKAASK